MITIDNKKCTNCGLCIAVCPGLFIEQFSDHVELVHKESCIRCYHCVAVCPAEAITCSEFQLDAFKIISNAKPVAPEGMRDLLLQRRSVREFKSKDVPCELLEELVDIASHAPTGHNAQGVEFSIITNRTIIDKLDTRILKMFNNIMSVITIPVAKGMIKTLAGKKTAGKINANKLDIERFLKMDGVGRLHIFRGAPVLVVAHSGPSAMTGKDDCVIALTHMMFAAMAHGLGATWIGYLVAASKIDPTIKKTVGIPLMNSLNSAIILGWPKYKYKRIIPRKTVPVKWIH